MIEYKYKRSFLLFTTLLILFSCNENNNKGIKNSHYTMWDNVCFDRASSIWLIKNYVDSTSSFSIIPFGTRVRDGVPFDVPGAELGRQRNLSCFESILLKFRIQDSALIQISRIVHDIDVNKWGQKQTPEAPELERRFKLLEKTVPDKTILIDSVANILNNLYSNKSKH